MTLSRRTNFWSEIEDLNEHIPKGKLEYLQERFRNNLYDFVLRKFLEECESRGLNQAQLAARINYNPSQLNRLLGAPGNWTLKTVSDLLIGISGEALVLQSAKVPGTTRRNMGSADLLESKFYVSVENAKAISLVAGEGSSPTGNASSLTATELQ